MDESKVEFLLQTAKALLESEMLSDELRIGTPGTGGEVRIQRLDFDNEFATRDRIDKAMKAQLYAQCQKAVVDAAFRQFKETGVWPGLIEAWKMRGVDSSSESEE